MENTQKYFKEAKMKIYIIGKVSGNKLAYDQFQKLESKIYDDASLHGSCEYFSVINPVKLIIEKQSEYNQVFTNKQIMYLCLSELLTADKAVVLPNYTESIGSQIEIDLCDYCKIPLEYLDEI